MTVAEPIRDDGKRLYRADLWGPPSERDLDECWFPEKPAVVLLNEAPLPLRRGVSLSNTTEGAR